jgi:hypothetical protein
MPPHVSTRDNLWFLITGPTIWAIHFLACYVTAAIYCEKLGRAAELDELRIVIAGLTLVALVGIALAGVWSYRRWEGWEVARPPHDAPTADDRRRFLGFSTLLLAGLSFVATIYTALPAALIATCR